MRELVAFALLGANAVFLTLAVFDLVIAFGGAWAGGFGGRSSTHFGTFVGLFPAVAPLVAVLITTHWAPITERARLVTVAALVQYAISVLFGLITLLGAFANEARPTGDLSTVRGAMETLLRRSVWFALLALAGWLVLRVWRMCFYVPRPPKPPAPYPGYPGSGVQPGYPPAYPGQPSGPPQYGYPPQPGYPGQPGHPSGYQGYPPPTFAPGQVSPGQVPPGYQGGPPAPSAAWPPAEPTATQSLPGRDDDPTRPVAGG